MRWSTAKKLETSVVRVRPTARRQFYLAQHCELRLFKHAICVPESVVSVGEEMYPGAHHLTVTCIPLSRTGSRECWAVLD